MTDLNPRLEEIAKAAAEISTMSSEEAFEVIMKGIIKVPEQLQMMIDSVVAIQFDWPMPEEGWKRFVESVDNTNERLGLNLHVNPPEHFDPLNIVEAQEKYATAIGKTRDELDDTEKMQAMVNAVLARSGQCEVVGGLTSDTFAHWKDKETEMETTFIMAYAVDTIKLIRATLRGTTEPLVPYKTDPLEFCREAHKVKDELISRAMELLENDIPITKQGDGWISVEKLMPHEDALYLIYAPSLDPKKPFIKTSWFNPGNDLGWQMIPKPWADAVTHWMLLPEPPSTDRKHEEV